MRFRHIAAASLLWTAAAFIGGGSVPGWAQVDFAKIEEETAFVAKYTKLLETADANQKALLIRDGLGDDNHEIRRIARETALESDDTNLRDIVVRHWVSTHPKIIVRFVPPKTMSDEQKQLYDKYSGALTLMRVVVDENGQISTNNGDGNFVDGGFQITGYGCFLNINESARTLLSGSYNCGKRGELAVQIDLQ